MKLKCLPDMPPEFIFQVWVLIEWKINFPGVFVDAAMWLVEQAMWWLDYVSIDEL